MCRWGCPTVDTVSSTLDVRSPGGQDARWLTFTDRSFRFSFQTFACKWCGTRFCLECLRGDFVGEMKSTKDLPLTCRKCKQPNCQGRRVEFAAAKQTDGANGGKKGGKKSTSPAKKSVSGSSSGATTAKKSKKKKK